MIKRMIFEFLGAILVGLITGYLIFKIVIIPQQESFNEERESFNKERESFNETHEVFCKDCCWKHDYIYTCTKEKAKLWRRVP